MNNFGFYIKKLQLQGSKTEVATVEFMQGLNVIVGPSDTGKTFIYQCIEYMLGSSHLPKSIPEAKKFSTCKLEIQTYDGDTFELERSLKGGDFKLKSLNSQIISKKLKAENNQSGGESISDFLLKICNFENKHIRKKQNGESNKLYFQDLTKYFLIDEESIITEESPISKSPKRGFNPLGTFEKNVLKYLLTGHDDSNITVALKDKEITNKKGKIELYDELIGELKKELSDIDYSKIDEQIGKIDLSIAGLESDFTLYHQKFKDNDNRRNSLNKEIYDKESRLINVIEILKRSDILKKQYTSDVSRLKATIEMGQSVNMLSSSNCPVCNHEIQDESVNIQELIDASSVEIEKINMLINELHNSQKLFEAEKNELEESLAQDTEAYNTVLINIENEFKDILKEITNEIKKFTNKKEELVKIKSLKDNLENYTSKKESLQQILADNTKLNKETKYEELTTTLLSPVINNINNILLEMKFDYMGAVGFSDKGLDLTIGEKNRSDFGKGYRAVLYAVFIVSIMKYLKMKPYQFGLAVLDSPLNPYKSDETKDDGVIPNNLADNFYTYLAKNIHDEQVILIENTPIPKNIEKDVNYIKFSKGHGFLPV